MSIQHFVFSSFVFFFSDLKLDNILLDVDGHVRIGDFGLCKLQIYLDRTAESFCGTPDYISPEMIMVYAYGTKQKIRADSFVCFFGVPIIFSPYLHSI